MRIALISDLHGNEVALTAVLEHIATAQVDRIVCLGDTATLGPRPNFVLKTLQEIGCACIMGNHDEFLLDEQLIRKYTEAPIIVQAVDWCRSQLSRAELDFVRSFQRTLEIQLDDEHTLFVYHGSPRSHMEDILATTSDVVLDEMLAGHHATVLAGGHTHIQMIRFHGATLIVNPGSVGLPFKEYVAGRQPVILPHAEYAIVDATDGRVFAKCIKVPLDKARLRESVASCAHPLRDSLLAAYA